MKYFTPTPATCEELKKAYRELAKKNHPDAGGSTAAMQIINNEYSVLFDKLKDIHATKDGETYTASKKTTETPEEFINIIDRLIRFEGITIEIIGCFVWVSGNTREYKDQLKEMGFKWSPNKTAWYLAPENYHKKGKQQFSMDAIRNMFGTEEIETHPFAKLA